MNPLRKKKKEKKITNLNLTINVTTFCFISYLEVQVKYIHLVHVLDTLTDLFYKHHGIHLSQRTALIHNSLEQFASLHTEYKKMRQDQLYGLIIHVVLYFIAY